MKSSSPYFTLNVEEHVSRIFCAINIFRILYSSFNLIENPSPQMLLPHEEYGIWIQAHRFEIGFSCSIPLFRADPIRCAEEHKIDTGEVTPDEFDRSGIFFRTDVIVGEACEPEQGKPVAFYEEPSLVLVGWDD